MDIQAENEVIQRICKKGKVFLRKYPAIVNLLGQCSDRFQRALTLDLLLRFTVIDDDRKYDAYRQFADYLNSINGNVLLSAMASDRNPDSSQRIIDEFKVTIEEFCTSTPRFTTRIDQVCGNNSRRKYPDIDHLVLIDEFMGSGQTLCGRIKTIREKRQDIEHISVLMVASMRCGINRVVAEHPDVVVICPNVIDRGISDFYQEPEMLNHMMTMYEMEDLLAEYYGSEPLTKYSFGYGQTEALITFGETNIPNNVFPWFWWKWDKNGNLRKRLFIRAL